MKCSIPLRTLDMIDQIRGPTTQSCGYQYVHSLWMEKPMILIRLTCGNFTSLEARAPQSLCTEGPAGARPHLCYLTNAVPRSLFWKICMLRFGMRVELGNTNRGSLLKGEMEDSWLERSSRSLYRRPVKLQRLETRTSATPGQSLDLGCWPKAPPGASCSLLLSNTAQISFSLFFS